MLYPISVCKYTRKLEVLSVSKLFSPPAGPLHGSQEGVPQVRRDNVFLRQPALVSEKEGCRNSINR